MNYCQVFQFIFQVAGDLSHARDFAVHPVFVEAMHVWFLGKKRNTGTEVLGGNNDAHCRGPDGVQPGSLCDRSVFSVTAIGWPSPPQKLN